MTAFHDNIKYHGKLFFLVLSVNRKITVVEEIEYKERAFIFTIIKNRKNSNLHPRAVSI